MVAGAAGLTWTLGGAAGSAAAMSGRPDAELVRELVRTGDDDLFSILVHRYKRQVHRLAAAVLGPGREDEAEDLTQEAFILVHRKLGTFRHQCSFSTWLFRLTRNLAIDRWRRLRRQLEQVPMDSVGTMADPQHGCDPEDLAVAGEQRSRLLALVDCLPEAQRMVVYLHYWMGATLGEIGVLLELRRETVKSHLYRARQRLARQLREERGDG